jgi:6-phosphofructokinase 1
MNAATRTAARYCLSRGHTPLGIYNGWPGLLKDNVSELTWLRVDQWTVRGGSELGTNRKQPEIDLEGIAYKLEEHKIDALLVIGGFEAFTSLITLEKARASYRKFKIPMIHLPATISNNVPVTDWSLGSDTSINVLVEACDSIKQSASASRNRVFVVETQGGECGYISVVGALAVGPRSRRSLPSTDPLRLQKVGAVIVYAPETGISLKMLAQDAEWLRQRYQSDINGRSEGRLIIRSEKSSTCYTTEVINKILNEEGNKLFDSRFVQLGHTLQGGTPSPRDRTRAVRLSVRCITFLEQHARKGRSGTGEDTIGTICITGANLKIVPLREMIAGADMKKRRAKDPWWLPLKGEPIRAVSSGARVEG